MSLSDDTLALPTPSTFSAFPYNPPYDIQTDLMKHLYAAIGDRKVAIVESPTGTGKTLSLLCASLTWLAHERLRSRKGQLRELSETLRRGDDAEPSWVHEQALNRAQQELFAADQELQERLQRARRKEAAMQKMSRARVNKKPRIATRHESDTDDPEDLESFLPESISEDSNAELSQTGLFTSQGPSHIRDMKEPSCTKIFYASRTHSQLSQLFLELCKLKSLTSEAHSILREDTINISVADNDTPTAVSLGSRRHLCINEELKSRTGDLDEACRELQTGGKQGKRCKYLPSMDDEHQMLELRDQILASPKDIEDLMLTGKTLNTCPYYGARHAIPQAQLVCLPYNLLLHRTAREALGIDLTNNVVIIDEAHNLIDTLLNLHKVVLPEKVLKMALSQLKLYFMKFRTRLTSVHGLHIKRLLEFMTALENFMMKGTESRSTGSQGQDQCFTISEFVQNLGSKVDNINLLDVQAYLSKSKLARKISGYCDHTQDQQEFVEYKSKGGIPPLLLVESLIMSLVNPQDDGRVTLSAVEEGANKQVLIQYQHLNPSTHFDEIVQASRSVVLAGGTMAPIADVIMQLFAKLPPSNLALFSCGHVIPPSHLQCHILKNGPSGKALEFTFKNRSDQSLMDELGQTLFNLVNIVPDGLVIFFPSYTVLDTAKKAWMSSGIMGKMEKKKEIFCEPSQALEVDRVLQGYAMAIDNQASTGKRGAMLFAVVGAKLSEGLNFSDGLARAVVLVGLPFANLGSAELKERMNYANSLAKANKANNSYNAGRELYENLCMKAVNQSIGRAIRHKNDWAALILIDQRYSSQKIQAKLPKWIGKNVNIADSFGHLMRSMAVFFRSKSLDASASREST